jgi:hypothetical protein
MAASAKANHPRRSLCARRGIDAHAAVPESLIGHPRRISFQKCSRCNLSGMGPVRSFAVITPMPS